MLQKSPVLTPSLENLSYILRHREWWPEGFHWNFSNCPTCAIGMCRELWGHNPEIFFPEPTMGDDYMLNESYRRIFCDSRGKGGLLSWIIRPDMGDVTPEQVANQIDRYLARHG
jgi:hypothetical protein